MQRRMAMLIMMAFCALGISGAQAKAPDKEVTLSGEMVCGRCTLKETKECQNVLKVTEGTKETKYYLKENDVAKSAHGNVCEGPAKATVKGTVQVQGKKNVLTAKDISYDK